jgi:hypothetical protein
MFFTDTIISGKPLSVGSIPFDGFKDSKCFFSSKCALVLKLNLLVVAIDLLL